MTGNAPDPRLDALLRDLPAPPVPAGAARSLNHCGEWVTHSTLATMLQLLD